MRLIAIASSEYMGYEIQNFIRTRENLHDTEIFGKYCRNIAWKYCNAAEVLWQHQCWTTLQQYFSKILQKILKQKIKMVFTSKKELNSFKSNSTNPWNIYLIKIIFHWSPSKIFLKLFITKNSEIFSERLNTFYFSTIYHKN